MLPSLFSTLVPFLVTAATAPLVHPYPGYSLRVEAYQKSPDGTCGLPSFEPVTGEISDATASEMRAVLAANEEDLRAVAEHYLHGEHPFSTWRHRVLTAPSKADDPSVLRLNSSAVSFSQGDEPKAANGAVLELHLEPLPPSAAFVAHKVLADATLAQLFRPAPPSSSATEIQLRRVFERSPGGENIFTLENLHAISAERARVANWSNETLPEPPAFREPYSEDKKRRQANFDRVMNAKLFQSALTQQPLPPDVFVALHALPPGQPRARWLELAVLLLSEQRWQDATTGEIHSMLTDPKRSAEVEYLRSTLVYQLQKARPPGTR